MGLAPVELAGRYRKTGDVRAVCHHKFYLDNQPVPFQRHGVSDSGSLLAGFHFLYGGFHWEKNMQTLAGVTTGGLSSEGFYVGFLLILILVVGLYVAYTGLIKRETTKAIHAVVNFVVVFVLSAAFIAYAPDYIGKINEFSADISNASLTLGTKIVLPNSESQGKDSVDLIRDSLFSIQVKQPWLLLQYGNSDVESLGADRVERLLSTSPDENNGQDREEIVVEEIEDRENTNLTITKTINRLGTVFFLFMFNIGISVFDLPAHGDNDFFTGAFYHLRYVPACELSP